MKRCCGQSVVLLLGAGLLVVPLGGGCASKAGTGALVGGAGGAAVGGLIGSTSHARAGEGALIGGVIGALGGALIGNEMDKKDRAEAEQARNYQSYQSRDYRESHDSRRSSREVSKEDVLNWSARGVREEVIIDRIERGGTVFHLTARDENELRDAGVSEIVIQAMKDTARR